jgi:FkbM family methyltransferase
MKLGIRNLIRGIARRSSAVAVILDNWMVSVCLFDKRPHKLPRKIKWLVKEWTLSPDRECHAVYAAYAGGDVLDVGASRGWYSVLLAPKAQAGDTFLSFEPDQRASSELQFTLQSCTKEFPGVNFASLPVAVGDGHSCEIRHLTGTDHPQFTRAESATGGKASITIDAVVAAVGLKPTFLKIDVEGAEYFVLKGAEGTLLKHRPTVMVEFHPQWQPDGVDEKTIDEFLERLGYAKETLDRYELYVRQLWCHGSPA